MYWTTPTLVEICIGLEINGYLPMEFHWLEGRYDRAQGLASELARRQVAVICGHR
jgi:coenzyme PQQ precursor peptide PqqA